MLKEYRITDMETGESVVFYINPEETALLERYAKDMTAKLVWTVLDVLAHSVRSRGIESIRKEYDQAVH